MTDKKEQRYKRLFHIIKLINFAAHRDPVKGLKHFVDQTIKAEAEDGLKQQLYDYFGLNERAKVKKTFFIRVYATNGLSAANIWMKFIQNNAEMAKWFGETVRENIARATPEVGVEYEVIEN